MDKENKQDHDLEKENKSDPNLGEEIGKLKKDVLFLQTLNFVQYIVIIGMIYKCNRIIEAVNLLTERLDLLDRSIGLAWDGYSFLFDILKELAEKLQFIIS